MKDLVTRLRTWSHCRVAASASDLMDEAAARIESLVRERNHWMRTATAFDEHLATLRVMLMEHPTVRFDASLSEMSDCPASDNVANRDILTDEERKAVEFFSAMEWPKASRQIKARSATLRGLLDRLSLQSETRPISENPTLTDEERGAVERAADWLARWQDAHGYHSEQSADLATLRGLLERMA
jgi:hypothetical protein